MKTRPSCITRRQFLNNTAGAGAWLAGIGPTLMTAGLPSQRVRLGVIGCGGRGRQLIKVFQQLPNVEIVGVSDVLAPRMDQALALFADAKTRRVSLTRGGLPIAEAC